MPDPIRIFQALSLSMIAAAVVLLLASWPWRAPHRVGRGAAECWPSVSGFMPDAGGWEFLRIGRRARTRTGCSFVLLPVVIVVEMISAVIARPTWLPWLLRLFVAAGAAPCLLYGSSYLSELAGPGISRMVAAANGPDPGWTRRAAWRPFGARCWLLAKRTACRSVPVVLAFVCAGAAVTIMLSGYASGGLIGLILAAAIVGGVIGSLPSRTPEMNGIVGLSVFGLFSLLVTGRFFGQLTTLNAALLASRAGHRLDR